MGAWGHGILQNDTTQDIWVEFKQMYHNGANPKEIRIHLENEYEPENDDEYYSEIWTGIAHGQWMCGQIENYTIEKIEKCVIEQKGMTLWADDEKLLKKRINEIDKFLTKIRTPREKSLKRKKIIPCPVFFNKGDLISIEISKDKYSGAIILENSGNKIDGTNTILFSGETFESVPTIKQLLNSYVMYFDIGGKNNHYKGYFWGLYDARNMKRKIKIANKIGEVNFDKYLSVAIGIPFADWNEVIDLYQQQLGFLKTNKTKAPFVIKLKKIISAKKSRIESKLIKHSKEIIREKLDNRNAS